MHRVPYSLFYGLFMSAVFLGAGEAIHLAITAGPQINVFERFLGGPIHPEPVCLDGTSSWIYRHLFG